MRARKKTHFHPPVKKTGTMRKQKLYELRQRRNEVKNGPFTLFSAAVY